MCISTTHAAHLESATVYIDNPLKAVQRVRLTWEWVTKCHVADDVADIYPAGVRPILYASGTRAAQSATRAPSIMNASRPSRQSICWQRVNMSWAQIGTLDSRAYDPRDCTTKTGRSSRVCQAPCPRGRAARLQIAAP